MTMPNKQTNKRAPLPAFGQWTPEQVVFFGRADDVIRLIDTLHAGAAG